MFLNEVVHNLGLREIFSTHIHMISCMCVREDQVYEILRSYHADPNGGYFTDKITTKTSSHAIIVQKYLNMQKSMFDSVMTIKGWVS